MPDNTSLRSATALLAMVLVLAGCKSSKPASSTASVAPARTTASAPAKSSASVSPAAGAGSASAAAGTKTCSAGYTAAMIGGVSKCLAPGQECSSKHINDYPQYGFRCEQNGTRYTLKKKA